MNVLGEIATAAYWRLAERMTTAIATPAITTPKATPQATLVFGSSCWNRDTRRSLVSGVLVDGFGVVRVVEGGRCGVGVGEVCLVFLFCGSGLVPVVGRDRMTGWGAVVGGGVVWIRGWLVLVVSSTAVVRM